VTPPATLTIEENKHMDLKDGRLRNLMTFCFYIHHCAIDIGSVTIKHNI